MSRHASKDLVQTTSKLDLNVLSVSVTCWLSECAAKLSTWYKLDTSLYSITNNTSRIEIISDCSQNSKPLIKHVSRFCPKSLSQQINPRPYRSQCQCVRVRLPSTNTPSSPPQKPPHTSDPTVRHDTPPTPR